MLNLSKKIAVCCFENLRATLRVYFLYSFFVSCKSSLHTNNVTWVASPENGRKVVLITTKDASYALAQNVLPPLSTHKLCTNRSFVLGDGRVSLRGWFGARGRGAQAQGSGIRKILCTQVFRHTNRVSGQSRTWTVSTCEFIEEWF